MKVIIKNYCQKVIENYSINRNLDLMEIQKKYGFERIHLHGSFKDGDGDGTLLVGIKNEIPTQITVYE